MTILFSLDNKRSKAYDRAGRLKAIHQVIFQDTWLIDIVATFTIVLLMVIINVVDPSSILANINFLMRILLILTSICFIHSLMKLLYRPNKTYKAICDEINFPIMVNSIETMEEYAKDNFPGLCVNYSIVTQKKEDKMGLLLKNGEDYYLMTLIDTPSDSYRLKMIMNGEEIKDCCIGASVIGADVIEIVIARLKSDIEYEQYYRVNNLYIDDSIMVYDKVMVKT